MTTTAPRLPRRPPLPLTSLTILLLVALPAWWLSRWPRPKAQGLEQLMVVASLLQSFPAMPERRLPELWRERLGDALGGRLWRLQRRSWWQLWGPHADGAAYLAIPVPSVPLASLVRDSSAGRQLIEQRALRVGNLLVLAPDPLARRLLRDALLPRQRPVRGLRRQCVEQLQGGQAVFWTPTALGAMLGPIAPLFQRYQEGCLSLGIAPGNRLLWQGQTTAVDGLQTAPPPWSPATGELPPLGEGVLLDLHGSALQPLLQGLVSRDLIRTPLAERYGVDRQRLERLERAPFRLWLRPLRQGPFLAGMELQLALEGPPADWQPVLQRIGDSLAEQGLQGPGKPPTAAQSTPASPGVSAASATRTPGLSLWTRANGDLLGGWRWLPSRAGSSNLVLFVGAAPAPPPALERLGERPGTSLMRLRLQPRALAELGLLPDQLPELVRRAGQLQMQATARLGRGSEAAFSQLTGQLQVERR
ncbi:MAG: hypothetical protein VKK97_01585 [Synechococcaceae cyanobacterium]|nr:hypothetical protein [Synechococcaceae cyanobacterium]